MANCDRATLPIGAAASSAGSAASSAGSAEDETQAIDLSPQRRYELYCFKSDVEWLTKKYEEMTGPAVGSKPEALKPALKVEVQLMLREIEVIPRGIAAHLICQSYTITDKWQRLIEKMEEDERRTANVVPPLPSQPKKSPLATEKDEPQYRSSVVPAPTSATAKAPQPSRSPANSALERKHLATLTELDRKWYDADAAIKAATDKIRVLRGQRTDAGAALRRLNSQVERDLGFDVHALRAKCGRKRPSAESSREAEAAPKNSNLRYAFDAHGFRVKSQKQEPATLSHFKNPAPFGKVSHPPQSQPAQRSYKSRKLLQNCSLGSRAHDSDSRPVLKTPSQYEEKEIFCSLCNEVHYESRYCPPSVVYEEPVQNPSDIILCPDCQIYHSKYAACSPGLLP